MHKSGQMKSFMMHSEEYRISWKHTNNHSRAHTNKNNYEHSRTHNNKSEIDRRNQYSGRANGRYRSPTRHDKVSRNSLSEQFRKQKQEYRERSPLIRRFRSSPPPPSVGYQPSLRHAKVSEEDFGRTRVQTDVRRDHSASKYLRTYQNSNKRFGSQDALRHPRIQQEVSIRRQQWSDKSRPRQDAPGHPSRQHISNERDRLSRNDFDRFKRISQAAISLNHVKFRRDPEDNSRISGSSRYQQNTRIESVPSRQSRMYQQQQNLVRCIRTQQHDHFNSRRGSEGGSHHNSRPQNTNITFKNSIAGLRRRQVNSNLSRTNRIASGPNRINNRQYSKGPDRTEKGRLPKTQMRRNGIDQRSNINKRELDKSIRRPRR